MNINETITLLKWEDERSSGEMERLIRECRLLHEQVIELADDVDGLKESLKKLCGSVSESAGSGNPYVIEEDDIVF